MRTLTNSPLDGKMREDRRRSSQGDKVRQVGFHDSVLNRHVKLIPDMVVVEEAFRPHPDAARVSRVLRIDTDSEGFFSAG